MTTTNDDALRARAQETLDDLRAAIATAPMPVLRAIAAALREMRAARDDPKQRQDNPAQDDNGRDATP